MTIMRTLRRLSVLILLLFNFPACLPQPISSQPEWTYADLRALDSSDDVPASQDLIALYLRQADENLEVRLDFLDLSTPPDSDISLVVYSEPYGGRVTVSIQASGGISVLDANGKQITGVQSRVVRDTFLDTVVISLNFARLIQSGIPFDIYATTSPATSTTISDQIGPVRSDAPPPPRGNILFTFWDTFQAASPSLALRAWDGAHSGPERSRHGLNDLLNSIKASNVPVFLLDLKQPAYLSALDFMGVLPKIQSLVDEGRVILPDVSIYEIPIVPPTPSTGSYSFGLPNSPFLYTTSSPDQVGAGHQVLFIESNTTVLLPQQVHPYRWQSYTILPISTANSGNTAYSPAADGPSLDLRRALIQATINPQAGIFMLGGEFKNTSWGDPGRVSPTLQYITSHPWMKFLNSDDLITLNPSSAYPLPSNNRPGTNTLAKNLLPILQDAPRNPITDIAWQTYLSLVTQTSPELNNLRAGYFGLIGHLLVAARWADRPGSVTDCTVDIDWDGRPECILASPDFFATFESSGGYAVVAFARRANGIHQIIAPYGQFIVGLGDPSSWNPGLGSEGDPALVPGGFVDRTGPWIPEVLPGQITFTNTEQTVHKIFRLTQTGIQVDYNSTTSISVQISLGLDPWRRFKTGWGDAYQEVSIPGGLLWAIGSDMQVSLTTTGSLKYNAFNASRTYLSRPEDPNFDYPAGHFIPFPLMLVEVNGMNNFSIKLDVK